MPAYVQYNQRTAFALRLVLLMSTAAAAAAAATADDDGFGNEMHLKWNRRLTSVVFRDFKCRNYRTPLRVIPVYRLYYLSFIF